MSDIRQQQYNLRRRITDKMEISFFWKIEKLVYIIIDLRSPIEKFNDFRWKTITLNLEEEQTIHSQINKTNQSINE